MPFRLGDDSVRVEANREDFVLDDYVDLFHPVIALQAAYPWLAAPAELILLGNHAQNGAAGSGVREVEMRLLDANYEEKVVVLATNGLTPVPIPGGPYIRLNQMRSTQVGITGGANNNPVYVHPVAGDGTTAIGAIPANWNDSLQCIYTVPSRPRGGADNIRLRAWATGVWGAPPATIDDQYDLQMRRYNETAWNTLQLFPYTDTERITTMRFEHVFVDPPRLPARADIRIRAYSGGASHALGGYIEFSI